jgi:hypothetical protein
MNTLLLFWLHINIFYICMLFYITGINTKILYNLLFKSCRFALRLRKTAKSTVVPTRLLFYIMVLVLHWFIPKSIINLLYLYFRYTVFALLVDLFLLPSFVYNFEIIWFILLYFVFFACITLLDDLFFCRHLNTLLVSGLLYIYFNLACVLVALLFSLKPLSLLVCPL